MLRFFQVSLSGQKLAPQFTSTLAVSHMEHFPLRLFTLALF